MNVDDFSLLFGIKDYISKEMVLCMFVGMCMDQHWHLPIHSSMLLEEEETVCEVHVVNLIYLCDCFSESNITA